MIKRILFVLRSGGVYDAEDVRRLAMGVQSNLPGAEIACLTDVAFDIPGVQAIPLKYDWPGWWSKIEMFRPDIPGGFLYMDLDSIITGDLSDMAGIGRLAIMRDVYRPDGLQSSVMFITEECKAEVWDTFTADPARYMQQYAGGGDQAFLEPIWSGKAAIWQDCLPGQIASYKANHIAERGLPDNCRAAIFHGQPKPRDIGWTL